MRISKGARLRSEDFDDDIKQSIDTLAGTLNPFIQEVEDILDGRIGYDNTISKIKIIEIQVDSSGKPILNDKIAVPVSRPIGFSVINAVNLTNSTVYPTSQPFISFSIISDNYVQIRNITGLQVNNKYRLTLRID